METQSQTIKNILELCESFGVPAEVVSLIRKKCWYLADSMPEEKGNGNVKEKTYCR